MDVFVVKAVDIVVKVTLGLLVMVVAATGRVVVPNLVEMVVELIVRLLVVLIVLMIALTDALERDNQDVRIVLKLEKKLTVLTTPVEAVVLLSARHLVLAYVSLLVTRVVRPLVVICVARLTHVPMAVKAHVPTVVM